MSVAERLARLEASSVAMLDPLITPGRQWKTELPEQMDACAAVAASLKLAGFAKLASHIARCLRKGKASGTDKEAAGQWVARAIVFCSGQMLAGDPDELIDIASQWELVARVSNAGALKKLKPRLAAESDRLVSARLRTEASQTSVNQVTVTSGEMQMLADACEDMRAALARDDPETERGLADFAERLGNAANALEHLDLALLSDLFRALAGELADAIRGGKAFQEERTAALMAWPGAWAQWFRHPAELTADQAISAHRNAVDVPERAVDPAPIRLARAQLQAVRLVATRPVAAPTDAPALSVQIPRDADPEVVRELILELPGLSNRLAAASEQLRESDANALHELRRVTHTMKGAANTVGVAGLAHLTHGLEDLLDVIAATRSAELEPEWRDVIMDNVDCIGDMVDAVVLRQEQSVDGMNRTRGAYRAAAELVSDLSAPDSEAADSAGTTGDRDATDVAAVSGAVSLADFELPDLNLPPKSVAPAQGTVEPDPSGSNPPAEKSTVTGTTDAVTDAGSGAKTDKPPAVIPPGPHDEEPATNASPLQDSGIAASAAPPVASAVSSQLVEGLLEPANEAAVLLAQARESMRALVQLRNRWQNDAERLSRISSELDRLADQAPRSNGPVADDKAPAESNDGLELEQFGEWQILSQRLAEVAADGKLLDQQMGADLNGLGETISKLEDRHASLRESILSIRLVDAQSVEPRLQRVARQAARLSGKAVRLELDGGDTRLDGDLLQALIEPLSHLVRNAVDHGLEPADQRQLAGKPVTGHIVVTFTREASSLRITVRDDGAGLDTEAIQQRAVGLGLIPQDARLDPAAMAQLVIAPGFSTREQVNQLSGRGIGLDVVAQALRGLRGDLDISFEAGLGASFELTLPMQMSSVPVFVMRSPTHVLSVSIRGIVKLMSLDDASAERSGKNRLVVDNRTVEVRRLDDALGLSEGMLNARDDGTGAHITDDVLAIVQTQGGALTALQMPNPGQTQHVVVRSLPGAVAHLPGIDGVAVLGDGAVAPVYDLPELIATTAQQGPDQRFAGMVAGVSQNPLCLLVDDSVSVRRATADLMTDLGLTVIDVPSAEQALKHLASTVPAVIVTDLEMPGMNGLELTRQVRRDKRLANVPIIMLTSRRSTHHQQEAVSAGVTHFVSKPYGEEAFSQLINGIIG